MTKFVAIYWRGNPQLTSGGYYTAKEVSGKTLESVERRLANAKDDSAYGSMSLVKVIERENCKGLELGTYGRKLAEEEVKEYL